jgi:hypothetical protein
MKSAPEDLDAHRHVFDPLVGAGRGHGDLLLDRRRLSGRFRRRLLKRLNGEQREDNTTEQQ